MGSPDQAGGSSGSDSDVPLSVRQRLAYESNSVEEYQQKLAQWKAQNGALSAIAQAFPPSLKATGVQIDDTHWVDRTTGTVWVLTNTVDANGANKPGFTQMSDGDSARYIKSIGGIPQGGSLYGGSGGSDGSTARLSTDDPRYWANQQAQLDLEYAKLSQDDKHHVDDLAYQYYSTGQTAENARRQALMQFIQSRDSLAANTAQTSASVAKQIADYAANPRDTYAEAIYRNQVGGSTPFGDLQNQAFGKYGEALQQKGVNIFQDVAGDLQKSREYRDALPLNDWLPADIRAQLANGGGGSPAGPAPDSLANASPEQAAALRQMEANRQMANASPEQAAALRAIEGNRQMANATPEQLAAIRQIAGQPASFAGGGTVDLSSFAGANQQQLDAINQIAAKRVPQLAIGDRGGSIGTPSMGGPIAPVNPVQTPYTTDDYSGNFYGWKTPEIAMAMRKYFDAYNAHPNSPYAPVQTALPGPSALPTGGLAPLAKGMTGTGPMWTTNSFAHGGSLNFDTMFADRANPGYSPSSSEGGTAMNLHERAVIVGESGHVYATLGEKRPDGSIRAEQLNIKPLKSEVAKDKKLEEGHKAIVESQQKTMASFAGGGTVVDDMNAQYQQLLQRLGGSGGGSTTPFGGARFLAGAPANALLNDPYLRGITEARYSTLPSLGGAGLSPEDLWAQIGKFTPQGITNNSPRTSFA